MKGDILRTAYLDMDLQIYNHESPNLALKVHSNDQMRVERGSAQATPLLSAQPSGTG